MLNEIIRYKCFYRRAISVALSKGVICSFILIRIFYLQIFNNTLYSSMSNRNRLRVFLFSSVRGAILDYEGILLSGNIKNFSLLVRIDNRFNFDLLFSHLNYVLLDHEILLEQFHIDKKVLFLKVIKNLSLENAMLIDINFSFSNLKIVEEHLRFYNSKNNTFHIVGYASILHHNNNNYGWKFLVGQNGLEKEYNYFLQGKPEIAKIEVDSLGCFSRIIQQIKSVQGISLSLSIRYNIHCVISKHFKQYKGAVIVMDLLDNYILAMFSSPSVNSNIFSSNISNFVWSKLVNHKYYPFVNKCISSLYHPGSIFKIIMFLALLKSGINHKELVFCPGYYQLGNRIYKCWNKCGHGYVDLNHAFLKSCNVYFFHQSLKIGFTSISNMIKELGFYSLTDINIPFEMSCFVATPTWKIKYLNNYWYLGDTLNLSIGQGYIKVTVIQLLRLVSVVATGFIVHPSVSCNFFYTPKPFIKLNVSYYHLSLLRRSMLLTTRYIIRSKCFLSGKTGTSQVVSNEHLSHNSYKSHSLFVGYSHSINPRFSIATVIENASWGSKFAFPISMNILSDLHSKFI